MYNFPSMDALAEKLTVSLSGRVALLRSIRSRITFSRAAIIMFLVGSVDPYLALAMFLFDIMSRLWIQSISTS